MRNFIYVYNGFRYLVEPTKPNKAIILGFVRPEEALPPPKHKYGILLAGTEVDTKPNELLEVSKLIMVYSKVETFCNRNAWLCLNNHRIKDSNAWEEYAKLFLPVATDETKKAT